MANEDLPTSESTGTISDTASAFEAILSGEPVDKQNIQQNAKQDQVSDADEAEDENELDASETADDAEDAEEGEEDSSNDEDEEKAEDSKSEEPIITLEIEGQEVKFTKDELKSSILRQADYTRKTQALAEKSRQVDAIAQQAQEQEKVYAQLIPVMVEQMQQYMPQPPNPALIESDPIAYMKQNAIYEKAKGDYEAAQSEAERMKQQSEAKKAYDRQVKLSHQAHILLEIVPEWKNEKTRETERTKLRNWCLKNNYLEEEIDMAEDARHVRDLRKAMKYDELMANKPKPNAPPLEKQLRSPAAPTKPQTSQSRKLVEAQKRLKQTGSIRAAASVFESLI